MASERPALIPNAERGVGVDEIARHAGVAVQSIYDHFGSKGGLLMAVLDEVQRSAGLYDAFAKVFRRHDGETALRRMIDATFAVWDQGWPYIEFMLRNRRIDPGRRPRRRGARRLPPRTPVGDLPATSRRAETTQPTFRRLGG